MDVNNTHSRHPREGGVPCTYPRMTGPLSWIPAIVPEARLRHDAGMTLALAFVVLVLPSSSAHAHTGLEHAVSFASGFKHPFTGLDHMLAMVAVGLWAGLNGGRALWVWPVAFVGVMVLGGLLGISGIAVPMVEAGILASVFGFGLLVLVALQLPVLAGAALVAAFALLHGHAHGVQLPGEAAAASYAAGFAIATAILHAIGIGAAHIAGSANGRLAVRGAGALVAVAGIVLAVV